MCEEERGNDVMPLRPPLLQEMREVPKKKKKHTELSSLIPPPAETTVVFILVQLEIDSI